MKDVADLHHADRLRLIRSHASRIQKEANKIQGHLGRFQFDSIMSDLKIAERHLQKLNFQLAEHYVDSASTRLSFGKGKI